MKTIKPRHIEADLTDFVKLLEKEGNIKSQFKSFIHNHIWDSFTGDKKLKIGKQRLWNLCNESSLKCVNDLIERVKEDTVISKKEVLKVGKKQEFHTLAQAFKAISEKKPNVKFLSCDIYEIPPGIYKEKTIKLCKGIVLKGAKNGK